MALTPSSMMPLGTKAPFFDLKDVVSGKTYTPETLKKGKGLVIMFICKHCPYVIHVQDELARIARHYSAQAIGFAAISSNDVIKYPDDSPENMAEQAKNADFDFPYLFDETQGVAKAYQAECTPDLYVFDAGLRCVYRGRLDESRPGNDVPVTGRDLRAALDAVLAGHEVPAEQYPSMGCNIKWK